MFYLKISVFKYNTQINFDRTKFAKYIFKHIDFLKLKSSNYLFSEVKHFEKWLFLCVLAFCCMNVCMPHVYQIPVRAEDNIGPPENIAIYN